MSYFSLTKLAKADLKAIAKYTQTQWGRKQRLLYIKQLDQRFHQLAQSPTMGIACPDIKKGYLYYQQGSHLIFYRFLDSNHVQIVRILHKRMQWKDWL